MAIYKRKIGNMVEFCNFNSTAKMQENQHPFPECAWEAVTVTVIWEKKSISDFPALTRAIAETGPSTRKKAQELGILPKDLYCPKTQWVDKAQGIGTKDYSFLSKKTLHEWVNAVYVAWAIVENDAVILCSSTFDIKKVDERLLITNRNRRIDTSTYFE